MASEKKHALYLVKDGERPKLFHGDDVEDARADGWSEPDFQRSNGTDWNPEEEQGARDAAAEFAKSKAAADDKKAQEQAKADEKARAEAEKARESVPETADMKVEIVRPKKAAKKK